LKPYVKNFPFFNVKCLKLPGAIAMEQAEDITSVLEIIFVRDEVDNLKLASIKNS